MGALGCEHRHIRLLQHVLGGCAVVGRQRDADAGIDPKAHTLELERLPQSLANTCCHIGCHRRFDERGEHQAKLVAAQTRDSAGGSHRRGETRPDLAQDIIPNMVSEAVVDLLETIKIDHEHGQANRRRARLETRGETFEEEPAVGQAGEIVGASLSSALCKRSQLSKRIRGPSDRNDEGYGGENNADGQDWMRCRVHHDAE
jgi:hypothetical protein